jgi:alpha-galactosidase
VVPPGARLAAGGFASFVAVAADGSAADVTWRVAEAGGGAVDAKGRYAAPQGTGTFHVVATSKSQPELGATAVVLVAAQPTPSTVSVTPTFAVVTTGATVQLQASGDGATGGVRWTVGEVGGGSVSASGQYQAPAAVGTYTVVASSTADPTQTATAIVAVTAGGRAPTPPMGWNSWNKFGCNLSESLVKQVADAMVSSGMAAAGYRYVNLDDCWQTSRTGDGTIVADPARFPSGIKALADYVHGKGLKLGVYSDRGTATCAGRPGSQGHEQQDAQTYASWGVDYLKHDNCNANLDQRTQYTAMRDALRASGREIVFSVCAWGFADWMPSVGDLWRTTGDINDSWGSVMGILDQNARLSAAAKPGAWNDPDMLEVGNGGMSETEYRSHFSLWAMMAAPLIAGNDLRSMSSSIRAILTAPEVIAVDQDPLGVQGVRVSSANNQEVWSKTLSGTRRRAVALFNRGSSRAQMTARWTDLGLPAGAAWVRDLWARKDLGDHTDSYTVTVDPHATVMLSVTAR